MSVSTVKAVAVFPIGVVEFTSISLFRKKGENVIPQKNTTVAPAKIEFMTKRGQRFFGVFFLEEETRKRQESCQLAFGG